MTQALLFGERSLTKVAGLFSRGTDARAAAEHVVSDARLPPTQVKVVGPGDRAIERKLEPEQAGIFHTMIRAHVVLGSIGLLGGLLLGWVLILGGVGFAVASPYFTLGVVGVFGMIGGLLLGGLVTLRPDHTLLISKVEQAVDEGHWAVVVHPLNAEQEKRAVDELQHAGGEVVRAL